MTDLVELVITIFREELKIDVPAPDVDVIETGLLDSLGLVTLVVALEQRCNVQIPFDTLEVEDFRTVGSIASLVENRRGTA
jgi:D-alanine--poly(phosphoribitol) ligase subunit 2